MMSDNDEVGAFDVSERFDDTASGQFKKTMFLQEARTKLIYLILDECLMNMAHVNGNLIIKVAVYVLSEDFFPVHGTHEKADFIFSNIALLISSGIFHNKGEAGDILSFKFGSDETDDLRKQIKKELSAFFRPGRLNKWLKKVGQIYFDADNELTKDKSKESVLN